MKLIFTIAGLFVFQFVLAQNRYDIAQPAKTNVPTTNYYQSGTNNQSSNQDLFELYQYASSIHERNGKVIDTMIDNLYDLKSQVNDQAFKGRIDEFLNQLKNLRLGSLLNAENEIKKIDWAIRDEVEKYRSGITTKPKSEFTIGNYYKVLGGGVLRDKPSVTGTQVGDESKYPIIKIISKFDDSYFQIEAYGTKAYIARAFIGDNVTQTDYENSYSQAEDRLIYNKAVESFSSGNYDAARTDLDKLISKYNDPSLFHFRALTYYYQSNFDNALTEVSKAISINPEEPSYFFMRGDINGRLNDFIKAVTDFSKAIELRPNVPDAYFMRASAKSELGDLRGAIKDYDMVIKLHSDTISHNYDLATAYNNKAFCFVQLEDYQSALPEVNRALTLNSEHWYIWDTRGEIFYKTGKYKQCIEDMNKAISIEERDNSFLYRGLAKIMLKIDVASGCEDLSRAGELGKPEAYEAIKKFCN